MSRSASPVVLLASRSPRRRELLERLGLRLLVQPGYVEERWHPSEPAECYVGRVAAEKAEAAAASITGSPDRRGHVVLGADTAVVLDGEPLGKPEDAEHARWMLSLLSGRSHLVMTAVTVLAPDLAPLHVLEKARVTFAELPADRIDWYVATGEPRNKAGGYAIQGAGAVLVEGIEGDPTTVIGLPLRTTASLLESCGVHLARPPAPDG